MNISKANKYTNILVITGIAVLIILTSIGSSDNFGGPQAQGSFILFMAAIPILLSSIFGFPLIYKISEKTHMPKTGFWVLILFSIITASILLTLIMGALAFGFNIESTVRLFLVLLCLIGLTIMPIALFWWVIAWKT